MRRVLDAEPGVKVDYAEIVNADTFEPAAGLGKACYAVIAARVGTTRLIDNAVIDNGAFAGLTEAALAGPAADGGSTINDLRVTL